MNGKYTRLRFCFLLFPPPVCAVVDHVECTSVWWKVASARCCVPFLRIRKKRGCCFGGGEGPLTWPQLLPSCVAPLTHTVLLYWSSHHGSRSLILQSTLKVHLKDCIFINLFKKKINNWGSGWCTTVEQPTQFYTHRFCCAWVDTILYGFCLFPSPPLPCFNICV